VTLLCDVTLIYVLFKWNF